MTSPEDRGILVASNWFDAGFYSKEAGAEFETRELAVAHYLAEGWYSGKNPSPRFDGTYYLRANADVYEAGMNPLVHYIRHGRAEGRRPALSDAPLAARPLPPSDASSWARLRCRGRPEQRKPGDDGLGSNPVDVVISMAGGLEDSTLAGIYSVLSAVNETPYRLVVIEDLPSAACSSRVHDLANAGLLTLLASDNAAGPVSQLNRALTQSVADVVILGSETLVYGDWLDRLRFHVRTHARVATVAPFSNNAEFLSYPFAHHDNRQFLGLDFPELDSVFACENREESWDIPAGAGSCLYITRQSLDDVGALEERLFPQSEHGARVDFGMRAIAGGWRNLAALDVFVRNTRRSVFGLAEADEMVPLKSLYPDYEARMRAFIEGDPLRTARGRVDIARFAAASRGRGILFVSHHWGGGIKHHVEEFASLLSGDGIPALTLMPVDEREGLALVPAPGADFPNLPHIPWTQLGECAGILRGLNLRLAHVQSLVSIPSRSMATLMEVFRDAGIEYDFSIHDYVSVCPRINMIDWSGQYCDSPSPNYCQGCIDRLGTPFGPQDIELWRARYGRSFWEPGTCTRPARTWLNGSLVTFRSCQASSCAPIRDADVRRARHSLERFGAMSGP
jgi:hypothetical protein